MTLASGVILFGACAMMLLGCFHLTAGIVALVDEDFYTPRPDYPFEIDATAWAWIHVVGGIALTVVAFSLLSGSSLARIVAIVMAAISAVWNFYSIPVYPFWSLTMLGLCILVLWALIAHGKQFIAFMHESPDTSGSPRDGESASQRPD
jgi:hypothetical protein